MEGLKELSVLIVDPAGSSKGLLRTLFTSLGIFRIEPLSKTDEALGLLREKFFDVIFCDEAAGPRHPATFVRTLRRDLSTKNITIPIVLVSAGTNSRRVAAWRDLGGNDVITKPVSANVIRNHLRALILEPKPFITTKSFIGPDRRRVRTDRRKFGETGRFEADRRQHSDEGKIFSVSPPDLRDS